MTRRKGKDRNQRHISISKTTYEKLRAFCELNGVAMARVVEARVVEYLDQQPEDLLDSQVEGPIP